MILKDLYQGQSVTRIYMNKRLAGEEFRGSTIDIGAGNQINYLAFVAKTDDFEIRNFDSKLGDNINFETDNLPAGDNTFDTVLFLNVMEHIYNYQHIANEVVRIIKPGGQLIGFVPFLMWYHPDHRDFFRYTHEAIKEIFEKAGANSIQVESVGGGPFLAAAHMVIQSFPRVLRPIIFIPFYVLDALYTVLKGKNTRSYALGYFFKISK